MDFVHTGPDTLAGPYLRSFWQPVHVADKLAASRALPLRIMGEDLTLYRGDAGDPHLLGFRCGHRGTRLSTGWMGDDLRCFCHGWKYGPDGRCIEQPAEPQPFCDRARIASYPAREYLGLIFVYLGDNPPPPFPHLPWQVVMPNLFVCDIGEGAWRAKLLGWRVPIDDGHFMSVNVAGRVGATQPAWARGEGARDRSEMARRAGEQADHVLEGALSMQDVTDSDSIFEVQDHVAQVGQGAIADRSAEHLGRADVGVALLRNIWTRELQALADGNPLTRWSLPDQLELDTGGV